MSRNRIFAVALRYLYLLQGYPVRVFQIFVWGTLDVVLWGFISKYLNSTGAASFDFGPVLLGAVMLLSVMVRAQQGTSTPFLEDIWSRNLLNFFASPLKIGEYLIGLVAVSLASCVAGVLFLFTLAYLLFGFLPASIGTVLFAHLLLLFFFGITLGIFSIAIVLRYGPAAEWFIWPIPAILSPFAAVYYPVSTLPEWMQWI